VVAIVAKPVNEIEAEQQQQQHIIVNIDIRQPRQHNLSQQKKHNAPVGTL